MAKIQKRVRIADAMFKERCYRRGKLRDGTGSVLSLDDYPKRQMSSRTYFRIMEYQIQKGRRTKITDNRYRKQLGPWWAKRLHAARLWKSVAMLSKETKTLLVA